MMTAQPTIFHITHAKAGSQWVREILKYSAPRRFVPDEIQARQLYTRPIQVGKIYAASFISRDDFDAMLLPWSSTRFEKIFFKRNHCAHLQNFFNFRVKHNRFKTFFVVRDSRDTLVSMYFSLKISHTILLDQQRTLRETLQSMGLAEGLMYLIRKNLKSIARIQSSWITYPPGLIVRYEDLVEDEHGVFDEIIDYCEIDINRQYLHTMIANNSFEKATGRKPGQEDISAHLRKGIVGDWRNYFTDTVKSEFKQYYGKLLIDTGYEKDLNW